MGGERKDPMKKQREKVSRDYIQGTIDTMKYCRKMHPYLRYWFFFWAGLLLGGFVVSLLQGCSHVSKNVSEKPGWAITWNGKSWDVVHGKEKWQAEDLVQAYGISGEE